MGEAIMTIRTLEREVKAAELIREQVRALAGEDPEIMRDAIEGETNLREILADMAAADGEDDAQIDGISAYVKKLQERKSRIERRADLRRSLMAVAMELAELPKLETPAGTITRKVTPPKVVITEEADIPSRFFVPQPPKLSLKEVGDALKARAKALAECADAIEAGSIQKEDVADAIDKVNAAFPDVPGATLSNGGATIQIRR